MNELEKQLRRKRGGLRISQSSIVMALRSAAGVPARRYRAKLEQVTRAIAELDGQIERLTGSIETCPVDDPRRPVRLATVADVEAIIGIDHVAQTTPSWVAFIRQSFQAGCCHVWVEQGCILGYGVIEHTFFGNGFISMLFVADGHRRRGIGSGLMRHMERVCLTPKLFTSTNQSNAPMQKLLRKLGYVTSGVVENLDENDPEMVFFKRLR